MEKSPPSLGNCVFLSFFSLFRSLSCLRLNIFETKYRQEAVSYAKETVHCAKKGLGEWWYRRFDDRGSRKCARAWQAERKKSSRKARLAVHCASYVPNWNVTILWKTGTHRRTTISNISYDSWIDRKEFFDIEDRGIQSCATNEKKIDSEMGRKKKKEKKRRKRIVNVV